MRMAMAMPMPDLKETPELKFKLEPGHNGTYECRVSSSVGTSTCTFNVSGESAGKEKKKKKGESAGRRFVFGVANYHWSLFLTSFFDSTARPYNAEFYYDTPNPVRIQKGNNYSYNLQWTQKDPEATDRIIGYWLNVRKVNLTCT